MLSFEKSEKVVITQELLCTKVFDFLRDAIIQGKLKPGEKLNVSDIANKLGVSRSPVREAIRILGALDFVESIPQRGAFVSNVTSEEIEDLYVVLKSLLASAAQLTAKRLNTQNIIRLHSIVQKLQEAKKSMNIEDIVDASRNFHNFVASASGNNLLFKLHQSMMVYRERPYLLIRSMDKDDLVAIIEEPIEVSKAILKGDQKESVRLMEKHMNNAANRTLRALSKVEVHSHSLSG